MQPFFTAKHQYTNPVIATSQNTHGTDLSFASPNAAPCCRARGSPRPCSNHVGPGSLFASKVRQNTFLAAFGPPRRLVNCEVIGGTGQTPRWWCSELVPNVSVCSMAWKNWIANQSLRPPCHLFLWNKRKQKHEVQRENKKNGYSSEECLKRGFPSKRGHARQNKAACFPEIRSHAMRTSPLQTHSE